MRARSLFLAASLLGASLAAHADTLTTWNLNGTLQDGGTVNGSVVLDETTGMFTSANFMADGYAFDSPAFGQGQFSGAYFAFYQDTPDVTFELGIPGTSAVGYAGSSMCSSTVPCATLASALNLSSGLVDVTEGTLTGAASVTPEPSSLLLLGTGVLGVAGIARRRILAA